MSIKIVSILTLLVAGALLAADHFNHHDVHTQEFNHEYFKTEQGLLSAGQEPVNYQMLFLHYKQIHNLKFGASEDSTRFNIFKSNCDKIVAHNANKSSTYELGLTDLAHLTLEEFAATRLGYNGAAKTVSDVAVNTTVGDVSGDLDWVAKGAVTPIKNQGQCGSCWSFSTTGALEGLNFIKNNKLVSLSEQELVDCSTSYGNMGCNGGLMDNGFKYVAANGLSTESDYPYTGADGSCQTKTKVFKNKGYKDVQANNPDALAAALNNGPVSVAIEADTSAFQLYKTGVLTGDACGTQLDHGVLAVGYGTLNGQAYFKVKNSWGPSWGNQGFVFIGRASGAGVCGINSAASYPTN